MGYRHSEAEIVTAAVSVALRDGLSRLTFASVAAELDIADRTVVYYLPTKAHLVQAVVQQLAEGFQAALAPALDPPPTDAIDAARRAWAVAATTAADPVTAIFVEALGLAAAGIEPYQRILPGIVDGWVAWVAERFDTACADRVAEASASMAIIEGLLVLRHGGGPAIADRAAARLFR